MIARHDRSHLFPDGGFGASHAQLRRIRKRLESSFFSLLARAGVFFFLRRRRRRRPSLSLNLTPSLFLLLSLLPTFQQLSTRSSRPAVSAPSPARRGSLHVVAARIAGVEIPNAKRVEASLQYIFGVGPTTAKAILTDTNIDNKRTRDLSEAELTTLRDEVEKYTTEGDLRRFNALNINRLKEIGCYRGRRHINSLPVRGQRTKTNARTRKGKAKTVANKKK